MLIRNVVIALLSCVCVWFAHIIIRLENYRYASNIGFCGELISDADLVKREIFLRNKQTRTNGLWHLYYALTDPWVTKL